MKQIYEIRIEGQLSSQWSAWFEGLTVCNEGNATLLCGEIEDQAALHGLLMKVRDLGLTLISVNRIEPPGSPRGIHSNHSNHHNLSNKEI